MREVFAKDVWGTFAAIRKMGLRHVELAGFYGQTPKELKQGLDKLGIKVSGSHMGFDAFAKDMAKTIEDHKVLECEWVILPWISETTVKEGWAAFGKQVEPFGEQLGKHGMKFAYHNHAFEFRTGRYLDLWKSTDPTKVYAQLDIGWVHNAGDDPVRWLKVLEGRVPLVHLKDFADDPNKMHVLAGKGGVKWDEVLPACKRAGVKYGVIEMDDPPGDPVEDTRYCLDFFRAKMKALGLEE